ncbi:NAD(P)-binding protein [Favolaschia claudopus]|uniref:NAD(P)-binding protein n=1 Tax=Favolaschia claudopus TaxID=2862362 RepID=A0AAW0D6Q1_9AGAR
MAPSILLLGATGVSGLIFIDMALSLPDPPALTLYVRSRNKLPQDIDKKARVIVGALTDRDKLLQAMEGVDTVVSVLGTYPSLWHFIFRTTPTPVGDAYFVILSAMRAKGVKRILALSTPAFYSEGEVYSLGWTLYGLGPKILTPQGNAEMVAIAKAVATADDLDWTIFRVPHLTRESADFPVVAGLINSEYKSTIHLSRASMCKWIFREMEERKWIRKAPMLAN